MMDAQFSVADKQLSAEMPFFFYKHGLSFDCYLWKSDWKALNMCSPPKKERSQLMEKS